MERRAALVEHGASGGVNVVAARLAGVRRAALDAVVRRDLLAVLAIDTVGVALVLQPRQARIVIGEVASELNPAIRAVARRGAKGGSAVGWCHIRTIPACLPTVNGQLPKSV